MVLQVIENTPRYVHTVSESETTFISSVDGKDFYYRYNGMSHIIDVRHSNVDYDYVSWTLINYRGVEMTSSLMIKIVPSFVRKRAKVMAINNINLQNGGK